MSTDREREFAPGKLWSLWELLKLEVGRLLELHETLVIEKGHFERAQRVAEDRGGQFQMEFQHFQKLRDSIAEVERIAEAANLLSTRQAAARTNAFLMQPGEPDRTDAYMLFPAEGCKNVFHHLMDLTRVRT
ncbi:MAG: hypothetical protein H0T56_03845, partial [Pseudaminobacter sp.]|nr:hypothetical protein [Pseudaminobacter sp.]